MAAYGASALSVAHAALARSASFCRALESIPGRFVTEEFITYLGGLDADHRFLVL